MNGGEMILNRIKSDCEERVEAIRRDALEKRDVIMDEAQQQAQKNASAEQEQLQRRLRQQKASAKSRAELETRNLLLRQRRQEIDKTVDALRGYLLSLDTAAYFDALCRMAQKLAGKSGEILLNQKDLDRLPGDFEQRLRDMGVNASVCRTPADIDGGFVLKSGDIEENMDFTALINARRDELEDFINRELFAE